MNGHIVGYSPFTLKLRNGKTWRWIQTWAKCTGRAKKNQNAPNAPASASASASSADLQATSRDAGSIPRRGFTLQQPTAHSQKIIFQVSSEPRSWGRGHSSPPKGGSDRTPRPAGDPPPRQPVWYPPPLQLGGAAASGTIPESTEDAEEAGGKQRLRNELQPQPPRASFAPLPRLTQFCALLLSLTFLHRLPGTSIPPSARGCRDPHPPERSRRRGRRGRDGKAGPLRAWVGARLRTHGLVLVPPAWRVGRASEMGLELRYVGRGEPAGANLRPELGAGL